VREDLRHPKYGENGAIVSTVLLFPSSPPRTIGDGVVFRVAVCAHTPRLIFGSIFAFIAVGIYVLLMIIRTWLEDKTL